MVGMKTKNRFVLNQNNGNKNTVLTRYLQLMNFRQE